MKITDEQILEELANGTLIKDICIKYELNRTSIWERLNKEPLMTKYNDMKSFQMESIKQKVSFNAEHAIELLIKIMNDETASNTVRIKSAKEILSLAIPKNNNLGG